MNSDKYDYIIVGSGAGGGPLAARLALAGKRVLVIEAGARHADEAATAPAREVSLVPALNAVSSEHPDLSWQFFVKHYNEETPPFGRDPKWYPPNNQTPTSPAKNGIFYPRASALGGCTIHNAMITIAGPDSDWDDLADFLGDDSWRSSQMRTYFEKLERNQYLPPPDKIPHGWWGRLWDNIRWLFDIAWLPGGWLRAPDYTRGRHGFKGWLHTSVADLSIGLGDKQLVRMLKGALWQAKISGLDRAWTLVSRFFQGSINELLDPNHSRTQAEHPEGVVLVPLAVCGKKTTIHESAAAPMVQRGRRSSPREFLLEVQAAHTDLLTIQTNCFVTKVLFEGGEQNGIPRAVGVEYLEQGNIYGAHPTPTALSATPKSVFVEAGGEVILCGGSFNTPQLLMLSGIGDEKHLEEIAKDAYEKESPVPNACALHGRDGAPIRLPNGKTRIDVPGIGLNLQDRYEVTVISEMDRSFSLLNGATFSLPVPVTEPDTHLKEWRQAGTGLYTSNGSVLGIFKRSRPDLAKPDLFIFGLPLPFRGYEVGYSKVGDIHNLFTWAILKGQTRNHDGTVRLRSENPLDTPEINFHYFNETSHPGMSDDDPDLAALVDGVKFVRGIANHALFSVKGENYPGLTEVPCDSDAQIKNWARRIAWGHHATGTCRMGAGDDENAVLDSRFRVKKVAGLRVVDASIFPKIPGYFIVTNVYMASEKAAEVILEDSRKTSLKAEDQAFRWAETLGYPAGLKEVEVKALALRRSKVPVASGDSESPDIVDGSGKWSPDVAGLAISGGGIRSATLNLGVLQALAKVQCLRKIDFLSTVSGGGYIGSFLGRIFDRFRQMGLAEDKRPPAAVRVEEGLVDTNSAWIDWLRKYANYIAPSGPGDAKVDFAILLRNFISVHFVVGILLVAVFGLANFVRYYFLETGGVVVGLFTLTQAEFPFGHILSSVLGPFFSPWFIVAELVFLILVLPRMIGYWVASQDLPGRFSAPGLGLMLSISSALLILGVKDGVAFEPLALGLSFLGSLVAVEMAWARGRRMEEAVGTGDPETQKLRTRSVLTDDLALGLGMVVIAVGFAVVDTIGHAIQQSVLAGNRTYLEAFSELFGLLSGFAAVSQMLGARLASNKESGPPSTVTRLLKSEAVAGGMALILLLAPLVFYSFVSHAMYQGGQNYWVGLAATLFALFLSGILAQRKAVEFANRSSLAPTYAARLARTFLGASNPERHHPGGADVTEVMPGDDVASIPEYRPHETGGPFHLINVTVNQTVDFSSQRGNRDRQGDNMAVTCLGLSIGPQYHALWDGAKTNVQDGSLDKTTQAVTAVGLTPGSAHPLINEAGQPSKRTETLSLREWIGLSGAAIDGGHGRSTALGTSLLAGLANLRTGRWWDSGIDDAARDGFPKLSFLRRFLYLLPHIFLPQSLIIFEWIARFPGPWERFWYISDGGFFEGTGAYELIRRRVPRIILCDALDDSKYQFEDFATLIRTVRIDFAALIEPIPLPLAPSDAAAAKETTGAYAKTGPLKDVPQEVLDHLGSLDDLKPVFDKDWNQVSKSKKHASLFWVIYPDGSKSVLLYIKSTVTGDETRDIIQYQDVHPEFPHESTDDQFFNEPQWESYRQLGEHIGSGVFPAGNASWLWDIPLH